MRSLSLWIAAMGVLALPVSAEALVIDARTCSNPTGETCDLLTDIGQDGTNDEDTGVDSPASVFIQADVTNALHTIIVDFSGCPDPDDPDYGACVDGLALQDADGHVVGWGIGEGLGFDLANV